MGLSLNLNKIEIGSIKIDMYVPDQESVRQKYMEDKTNDPEAPFPFWTKIWPSALAMAEYLQRNRYMLKGKKVLEMAAGLGLPSIVAAMYAEQVCCSDYMQDAVNVSKKNMVLNKLANVDCRVYNWRQLPDDLSADILLLSDVNYAPAEFAQLITICQKFLLHGTTIILTTPGRIIAKDFIDRLYNRVKEKEEMIVKAENLVYVFVLQ